jgi:protein transport protein SEC24
MNLSAERFVSEGVYLVENGVEMYLWVGARTDPSFLSALFGGLSSLEGVDSLTLARCLEEGKGASDISTRVHNILQGLREERPMRYLTLNIVMEGDPTAASFYWNLVEDRASFSGGQYSYAEFINLVGRQQAGPTHAGPPMGMGGAGMYGGPPTGPPVGQGGQGGYR